ncbi:MAG: S9 family peptidase [Flavobacteriales bacterium]|nr:S9 family peptidase [Flavobacteriales bacterium]
MLISLNHACSRCAAARLKSLICPRIIQNLMKNTSLLIIGMGMLAACTPPAESTDNQSEPPTLTYPESRIVDQVDDYWGTQVADPYRWLENDTAPEVEQWVADQNAVTFNYLHQIQGRDKIKARYAELFDYEKVSSPYKVGDNYFFYKNSGLQNQDVIYKQRGLDGEPEVFIDPNALSADGTITVDLVEASKDHKYMAITQSEAGSDWSQIRVMDVETGAETGDTLRWIKFGGASWYKDGFFYSRYPEPAAGQEFSAANEDHQVYYHKLGTPQSEDELVYRNGDNLNLYHWVGVTEDERYLILYAASGTDGYECYFSDLSNPGWEFTPLFTGFEHKSYIVNHVNDKFLVRTDIDAPKYRVVAIDPNNTSKDAWTEVIPEKEHLLEGASTGGGKLFATYLENASTRVYKMNYDGSNAEQVQLPDNTGSAGGFGARSDENTLYYTFTSFTYPATIYRYDIITGESSVFYQPAVKFNPDDYESHQVFFKSKDGTEVPMFIVHKKGLAMDGNNPTMLYGYGGFNVSLTPSFSTSNIILLENGGVYAMVNLRGGGEFGEEWHKGGMLLNKQNVFDDFIGAAETLISKGYTSNEKLAIAGGSNGGLLVGACMTQRPELFKVAFPAVGVMDMLRYNRFTVGWGWIPEYGCADSSKVDFDNLYAYSPLHNLKEGVDYPATMVTTADHDDRVVPAHSFKFAARLQACHAGKDPVIIRIQERAGHGAGKPTAVIIEEQTDKWAFMFDNMGVSTKY